jgi:flavin reductase (DIM6/NTAB) family NADH-FMN oxidoreductase RutF
VTRRSLDPLESLRLLNGGPVALITTRWRDKTNVMPAIWYTPLSRTPPLIGVVVHPGRYTHDMIKFSEEFAISFPAPDLLNHTHYFGMVSGVDVGKLELAKLATFRASKVEAPLIENCIAWIECGLEDSYRIGDHELFVGRVLVAQTDLEAFGETWSLEDPEYRPLHYLGADRYASLGHLVRAQLRTSEDGAIELGESQDEREQREEAEAREREQGEREREGSGEL